MYRRHIKQNIAHQIFSFCPFCKDFLNFLNNCLFLLQVFRKWQNKFIYASSNSINNILCKLFGPYLLLYYG